MNPRIRKKTTSKKRLNVKTLQYGEVEKENRVKEMALRFKRLRLSYGYDQKEWGELLDLARPTVAAIETARQGITIDVLRQMKMLFGVSYDYLIDGSPIPSKNESDSLEYLRTQLKEYKATNAIFRKILEEKIV